MPTANYQAQNYHVSSPTLHLFPNEVHLRTSSIISFYFRVTYAAGLNAPEKRERDREKLKYMCIYKYMSSCANHMY